MFFHLLWPLTFAHWEWRSPATPRKLALLGQDPTAALPWCGRAAGGPSTRSWGYRIVDIVEIFKNFEDKGEKVVYSYNMQNCEYIFQVLMKNFVLKCSEGLYHGFSTSHSNVVCSLNQMHTAFFCIGAGIGGKSMAGHLLIFGTASPASLSITQFPWIHKNLAKHDMFPHVPVTFFT